MRRLLLLLALIAVLTIVFRLLREPPRPPVDEPRALRFVRTELALGRLEPGEHRRVALAWRRTGRGSLRVLGMRTGCGCVAAQPLPRVIAEGASGTLAIAFTARDRPGPARYRIRVVTDAAPGRDVVDAWIGGHVEADVAVRPTRLVLEAGRGGETVVGAVEVHWDRASTGRLVPLARLVGVAGRVEVLPPARAGADACQVVVSIERPVQPGRIRGWIELDLGVRGPLAVPVEGVVHPNPTEALGAGPR